MSGDLKALVGRVLLLREVAPDLIRSVATSLEQGSEQFQSHQFDVLANIVHPQHRGALKDALVYAASIPGLTTHELAGWLRTMSRTSQEVSAEQDIQLLWTGPHPVQSDFRMASVLVPELIEKSRYSIWLASYTVSISTDSKFERALLQAKSSGVRIRFLCERAEDCGREPDDGFTTGWRNISPELKNYIEFYCWPKENRERYGYDNRWPIMHAKTIVIDSDIAVITSANLTWAAEEHNMEFGTYVRGGHVPSQIEGRFDQMVSQELIIPFAP